MEASKLSSRMVSYLWEEAEKKALISFDALFTFCRATKHGFCGNREKTECEITIEGVSKKYYFNN